MFNHIKLLQNCLVTLNDDTNPKVKIWSLPGCASEDTPALSPVEPRILLRNNKVINAATSRTERSFPDDYGCAALSPDGRLAALRSGVFDFKSKRRLLNYDDLDTKMNVAVTRFSSDGAVLPRPGSSSR